MKKPTKTQYLFASRWPERIWFLAVPLLTPFIMANLCLRFLHPLGSLWDLAQFVWYCAIAFLLGFFLALFPGWFVIGPLYYDRELKNGGPFEVGDLVQILAGQHKGRISRIYSTWQGNAVRVELGEKEKEEFRDIFSPIGLLKEEEAEQETRAHPLDAESTD